MDYGRLFGERAIFGDKGRPNSGSRGVSEAPFERPKAREMEPGKPPAVANILLIFFSLPDYGFPCWFCDRPFPSPFFSFFFFFATRIDGLFSFLHFFSNYFLLYLLIIIFLFVFFLFFFLVIPCFEFCYVFSYLHCHFFFFFFFLPLSFLGMNCPSGIYLSASRMTLSRPNELVVFAEDQTAHLPFLTINILHLHTHTYTSALILTHTYLHSDRQTGSGRDTDTSANTYTDTATCSYLTNVYTVT